MPISFNFRSTGAGIPFLFQHGLGGNLQQAQDLLAGLEGVQLISMDSRGHGQTPFDPTHPPSFNQYADDAVALLDHLGIEKAVAGGISMGSGIALNLAVRYPERVLALVLVRPAWLDHPDPANLSILSSAAAFMGTPLGQEQFQASDIFIRMDLDLPNAARSILGQFAREQGQHTAKILKSMIRDAPVADLNLLRSIRQPALILASERDPLHPLDFGIVLDQYLPDSRFVEVTSKYVDEVQHAREVLGYVREFVIRQQPFLKFGS